MALRRVDGEDATALDGKGAEGASNLTRRGACRGKFGIDLLGVGVSGCTPGSPSPAP